MTRPGFNNSDSSARSHSVAQPDVASRRTRRAARIGVSLIAGGILVSTLAACAAAPAPIRYRDKVFASVTTSANRTYATAPALITGASTALKLDLYSPAGDTLAKRPAIVWIHGGGFASGDKSDHAWVATEWARRGYVTAAINYRLDSGNKCQNIQDGKITDPAKLATETTRCRTAIKTAQYDAQAAIRWLRANASSLKIDPTKIAVAGTSAGAVTAVNVAHNSNDPGTVGTNRTQSSAVRAALAASGCNYEPSTIGAGDAPTHLLASKLDQAVDFRCVAATESAMRTKGLSVGTRYYANEGTHAMALYKKYQGTVDADWTAWLMRYMGL